MGGDFNLPYLSRKMLKKNQSYQNDTKNKITTEVSNLEETLQHGERLDLQRTEKMNLISTLQEVSAPESRVMPEFRKWI